MPEKPLPLVTPCFLIDLRYNYNYPSTMKYGHIFLPEMVSTLTSRSRSSSSVAGSKGGGRLLVTGAGDSSLFPGRGGGALLLVMGAGEAISFGDSLFPD